ncbi:MAG TPA: cytochrome c biogenesis protein CcsA [Candidatus Sulfobium mesophilum]|nr:cytochrome c biogenesis protein CcsA [Candidatus Sulfobium mesophilum]
MTNLAPLIPVGLYLMGLYRTAFVYAGFIVQAGYMLFRGMQLGRLPIIGPHDTLYFLSASTVLFGLPMTLGLSSRRRHLIPIVGLAVFFALISLFYPPHNTPLPPVLKTFWFESHVTLSFFSYALFGIAAALGMTFILFKGYGEDTGETAQKSVDNIEVLQYKAILVGYFLFSAAMVFGGIWAYLAWGTYWLWTPKELWTVILWLFYSLYLHARLRRWWSGKPSAVLGIVGFVIVMFTYLGVSLLMKSSHAF